MENNYDPVSFFYDPLSKLVFGTSLIDAQIYLLDFIPAKASILIAGGGTGWILEKIADMHNSGLKIVYVELSEKMLAKSKKRKTGKNEVTFVNAAIQEYRTDVVFDVIITCFLFDNFNRNTAQAVFMHLQAMLRKKGKWLISDFKIGENSSLWQRTLLNGMYFFFSIFFHIEGKGIPDMNSLFKQYHYVLLDSRLFFKRFIESKAFEKTENVENPDVEINKEECSG